VKWYGKYRRNPSWIVKRYGQCGRKGSWIVKIYEKYGRKESWIVIRFGKYGKLYHYSTFFSSIFSISFHYSTYCSSIFSLSFHYSTYVSSIIYVPYLFFIVSNDSFKSEFSFLHVCWFSKINSAPCTRKTSNVAFQTLRFKKSTVKWNGLWRHVRGKQVTLQVIFVLQSFNMCI
jgi:hypothetical protein